MTVVMPIYIVRWPGFNVSLVRAHDEEELQDMLDEVADPGGCRWEVYKGPLWIDLDLPVRVAEPIDDAVGKPTDSLRLRGVNRLFEEGISLAYKVDVGGSDTRADMLDAVTKWAFPALFRVTSRAADEQPERPKVVKALRRDLVDLLRYAWRRAQTEKRTDDEGLLLRHLGLTKAPPWFRQVMDKQKKKREEE